MRRPSAIGLLVVLALVGVACASEEERFQAHLEAGQRYYQDAKYREALVELRGALKLEPQNALVNERIAEVFEAQGDYQEAVFFYREAQRLDAQRVEPFLAEARLLLGSDLERAQQLVDQALARDPSNPWAHATRAELALAQADTETALTSALTALELDPDDPRLHLTLGIVHRARIRERRLQEEQAPDELYTTALEAFEKAKADRSTPRPWIERARTFASWPGHREQATQAFREAVEFGAEEGRIGFEYLAIEQALAWARQNGEQELRRWALQRLFEMEPETLEDAVLTGSPDFDAGLVGAWGELAALEEQREEGAGEALLQRLLERRPRDLEVHLLYARFLTGQDRVEDALTHLRSAAGNLEEGTRLLDDGVRIALAAARIGDARELADRLQREAPDDPRTWLAQARLALSFFRLDEAAELLRRVNDVDESAESHRLLASAEFRKQNLPAAMQEVDRALELDRTDEGALRLKASIHHRTGDWTAVVQTVQRLAQSAGGLSISDRLLLVEPFFELEQPDTARRLLRDLVAKAPDTPAVAVAFARHEGERQPEAAIEAVEKALAGSPRDPRLVSAATQLDVTAGRFDRALARIDRLIDQAGPTANLLSLRARVRMGAGQPERALADARQAFDANPDLPGTLDLLMFLYRDLGRLDEAIAELEQVEDAGLLSTRSRVLLGRLYLSRGDFDRAEAMFETALQESAELPGVKNDLAYLLARKGQNLDRALQLAQEAQQVFGVNAAVADTLGYVFLRKGLAAPAVEQFRYAISLADEDGDAPALFHYHLGLALRALGREADASESFERALAVDPNFPDAGDAKQQLEQARASAAASP